MKKLLFFSALCIFACCLINTADAKTFYVYADKNSPQNHFMPSGWMGDYGDLQFNDQSQKDQATGVTALEIGYSAKKTQGQGWAGIYWQSSQNNWGQVDSGFDLSEFNKLVFKAKGENGGEVISVVKVGGITNKPSG